MYEFRKKGKKWSENVYVFYNSSDTPFTPDILSKNFNKFIKRNKLPHIVIYGLRHSFATHCRNLGMKPEVLARLMGIQSIKLHKNITFIFQKSRKKKPYKVFKNKICKSIWKMITKT